jgi:hypothetical protein
MIILSLHLRSVCQFCTSVKQTVLLVIIVCHMTVILPAGLLPFSIGTETWGSIVCPAVTVGVSAYRPTGGVIPTQGILQVCYNCQYTCY